jgi:hypothetical protein
MGWLSWQGRAVSGVGREGFGKGRKGFAIVYNSFLPFPVAVRPLWLGVYGLAVCLWLRVWGWVLKYFPNLSEGLVMMQGLLIGVRPRVLPNWVLEEEPWRKDLQELLVEYVRLALFPTAYGVRQVVEVLQELRELMLMDGIDHHLVGEAMEHIKKWVELAKRGEEFDLGGVLRSLREFAERLDEGWDGAEG